MPQTAGGLLVLVVLADFLILGTIRLSTCIRAIAFQGLVLGVLPLALHTEWTAHVAGLVAGTIAIKAILLPWLLRRAIREAAVRREVEPRIDSATSVVLGIVALAMSFAIGDRLPVPGVDARLLVPAALATVMMGLLVLTTRLKALMQVVGYLMLENGVFVFGLTLADRVPFLLEVGVLLDVFAGVFIMGIVVFHINREFDSISSANLSELRE